MSRFSLSSNPNSPASWSGLKPWRAAKSSSAISKVIRAPATAKAANHKSEAPSSDRFLPSLFQENFALALISFFHDSLNMMMLQYAFHLPLTELVSKTPNLEKIPIVWNVMKSEEYVSQVKATGDVKKFNLIHMIHVRAHHFDLICCGQILLHHTWCGIFIIFAIRWSTTWKTLQVLSASTTVFWRKMADSWFSLQQVGPLSILQTSLAKKKKKYYRSHEIRFAKSCSFCFHP